jgi:hypothetical protein
LSRSPRATTLQKGCSQLVNNPSKNKPSRSFPQENPIKTKAEATKTRSTGVSG